MELEAPSFDDLHSGGLTMRLIGCPTAHAGWRILKNARRQPSLDQPAFGQVRVAIELRNLGHSISLAGVRRDLAAP